MKRITSIICLVLLCVMLFTGCTGAVRPTHSPVVSPNATHSPAVNNSPAVDHSPSTGVESPYVSDHLNESPNGTNDGVHTTESPVVSPNHTPVP